MIRVLILLLVIILYLVLSCIPAFVLWLIGKKNPGLKDRVSRSMTRWIMSVLLFISGTKIIVEGQEKIPADRPVLYVGNHRSYFDVLIAYQIFPGITGFVAKKELGKIPLLSLWMRYIHCLFLDRQNVREGLKTILAGVDMMKNGTSLCIFPEGTRNRGEEGSLMEFKEGSLKLAERSASPVVPFAITHSADILENHFPKLCPTTVKIRFADPIDLQSLSREEKKFAGAHVKTIIQGMLDELLTTD